MRDSRIPSRGREGVRSHLLPGPGLRGAEAASPLSPYIQGLMQALLIAAEREDSVDTGLRSAAYEALNQIIRCSTEVLGAPGGTAVVD